MSTGSERVVRIALIAARIKIAAAGAWTQHTWARDGTGQAVFTQDDKAVCFCSIGALKAVLGGEFGTYRRDAERALELGIPSGALYAIDDALPFESLVVAYNDADGRTQAEILAMFDKAIEELA